ncbi:MAG: ADP-L-glycero-D-manno-heptose-6-epimerase [Candidatus Kaiserbacteria bacterium]|nr:ADP-L-glycero-D-manno-heptose-6-epimerase [Candidatus Kaiserbacteria bacterium]
MNQKTVLVTGGAGFVGTHLCKALLERGNRVISLDNYFTGSRDNHIEGVEYIEGHTKDIARHITDAVGCIYHLGEYSRVEISFTEPALVWDFNIAGTLGVLEFWRASQCKLIYAGSSTKFADGGMGRDQSPYAWSKASNTDLVRNYGQWFGLRYAITYFYNVYGPGERSNAYGTVIEIFKQKFLKGERLTVTAPGTQERIFTHVDDIVRGLLLVGEKGEGDEFGLGAERSYSILEIAKLFNLPIEMLPERQGNRLTSILDATKSYALGWSPEKTLEEYVHEITKIHS